MHTYASALALADVVVPAHLAANAEVPILTEPQAQGDLIVFPAAAPAGVDWRYIVDEGVQVVRGEATGNTHWLYRGMDSTGVRWAAGGPAGDVVVANLLVPPGQSALLIHTAEHGANGIGPGTYAIHRKRARQVTTGTTPSPQSYLIED